jgi:acyl-CoA reductase-like NAD-dependent aldehyde dehydrogenase
MYSCRIPRWKLCWTYHCGGHDRYGCLQVGPDFTLVCKADERNEIFGPVLSIVAAETMDEAIEIINANK